MATIQAKTVHGNKYWYIVESRRVNGKPRPIVLEYLGTPETLMKRLRQEEESFKAKSYSHGALVALLKLANELNVVTIINKYIQAKRPYMAKKPTRHGLTVGITLLLAAIGRVCMPSSKRGWWDWAKTTSCEYMLRTSLSKMDSQHFWDLMDCLPEEKISKIELEILDQAKIHYNFDPSTLLLDTTNFYTFIDSGNKRCDIAQRGKNKQKRADLRQVGLAMVVTRKDYIPIFHHTYQGNLNDCTIFDDVITAIKTRMKKLGLDLQKNTIVFDRGFNSKKNLAIVKKLQLHYVGALTPYHLKDLIKDAKLKFEPFDLGNKEIQVYRDKRMIWGDERTVIVYISQKLKIGQLRGIYTNLQKKSEKLTKLENSLTNPRGKKYTQTEVKDKIDKIIKGQFMKGLIDYTLLALPDSRFKLQHEINKQKLFELEESLGFRILMTNRHEWNTAKIISAYHGQSTVEQAFKNIKNPYHLAVTPGFHWTDQKLRVHYFICVLGYLLATLIWRQARDKTMYSGTLDNLLDQLNDVRLATMIGVSGKKGKPKVTRMLEEMSTEQAELVNSLELTDLHHKKMKIDGISVYN
jgi:transposase